MPLVTEMEGFILGLKKGLFHLHVVFFKNKKRGYHLFVSAPFIFDFVLEPYG